MEEINKLAISSTLILTINNEYKKLRASFTSETYQALQILIRRLDAVSMFYWDSENQSKEQVNEDRYYFNYGWAPLLKLFFEDHDFNTINPLIQTFQEDYQWADSVFMYSGRLSFCRQLLDYEKADLLKFHNPKENEFEVRFKEDPVGSEYFERASFDFFRDHVVERIIIDERKAQKLFSKDEIKLKLREIIKNPLGKLISYETTPEIDEFYDEMGHRHILRIQGYDGFDSRDTFGSIEYWRYINLIEIVCGAALMHTDACVELIKMNPEVDIHNILTHLFNKEITIKTYSNYFGMSYEEIEQILSCVSLTKDNFEHHLSIPVAAPPMYFEVSEKQLVRSITGCVGNPFRFLNIELKRKFKRDYDIAVNNRETRFRKDLFMLFPHEKIIKIPNEINISFNGMRTDIDAVAYDTETKTLGLFQLKWQDPFAHSIKERFSRISNLFPKANEWIGKIGIWLSNNDVKTILNSLQITKYAPQAKAINEICVFVIARNHIHFSGVETDKRVAWGSWHQLIELSASVQAGLNDPIKEMFVKLKFFAPEQRMAREELPDHLHFDAKIGNYRVYFANEDNDIDL